MSQINNVITTTFRARGNQAIATMGSIAQGFGNVGRVIAQNSRLSERLNNQWRAMGTTMRYAIAGSAVFGIVRMRTELAGLQRQIGLIQALGNARNGILPNTGLPVRNLIADARLEAVRAVTPINEFNEGLINMFSSIENVPENQAARMMREISLTAQLAQTDSESASKAIFGMLNTFSMTPNMQNIQRMSRVITELIASVPGGPEAGRQIFQQYPQLAAVMQMGHGTIPQMLGLYMSLLRTGGTPATSGRGLQFLLQTIANPQSQTKESRRALASVGITPQFIEQRGVVAGLLRLITAMRERGGVQVSRGARRVGDDELEAMADAVGENIVNQMNAVGITGPGARLASAAIPRIHGVRALTLLASRPEQTVKDLQEIDRMWNGYNNAIQEHEQRVRNLTEPRKFEQAGIAMTGLRQQVALALEPVGNLAASGIIRAHEFTEQHPGGTRQFAMGGAGLLAALGIGRMLGAGRYPVLNRIPGLRGILGGGGRMFVGAQAMEAAANPMNAGTLGASPQNPLYVIVVGTIFGKAVVGGTNSPNVPPGAESWLSRNLGKVGVGAAATARYGRRGLGALENVVNRAMLRGVPLKGIPIAGSLIDYFGNPDTLTGMEGEARWIRQQNLRRAQSSFGNQFGGGITAADRLAFGTMNGHAEVWMTIDVRQPGGKIERKRVHVPLDLWSAGRVPGSRAQAGKTTKGN